MTETRKRKRGALQDISNTNTKSAGHASLSSVRPMKKTSTTNIIKKPVTRLSTRTRSKVAPSTKPKRFSHSSRKCVSQKKCTSTVVEGDSESNQHVKIQTSLLSYPSISSTKTATLEGTIKTDVEAAQQTSKILQTNVQSAIMFKRYDPRSPVFTFDSTGDVLCTVCFNWHNPHILSITYRFWVWWCYISCSYSRHWCTSS